MKEYEELHLNKDEMLIIKEALTEYWHNTMKNAKETDFKKITEYLKDDFKERCLKTN